MIMYRKVVTLNVWPVDFSSDIGKVRALIPDVDQVDFNETGTPSYIFDDAHLATLLGLYGTNEDAPRVPILRAAADACEALAVSEVLISKVTKTEDLQTDGARSANAIMARAIQLRAAANQAEQEALEVGFTIIDFREQPAEVLPYGYRGWPAGAFPWVPQIV